MNRLQIRILLDVIEEKNSWGKNQLKDRVDRIIKHEEPTTEVANGDLDLVGIVTNEVVYTRLFKGQETSFGKEKLKVILLNLIIGRT
jgi:hypothetical protein